MGSSGTSSSTETAGYIMQLWATVSSSWPWETEHGWMPSTCSGPWGLRPKAAASHRWAGAPSIPCLLGFAALTLLTRSSLASFSPWGTLHPIQGNTVEETVLSFGKDLKLTADKQGLFRVMVKACGMVIKSTAIIVYIYYFHDNCSCICIITIKGKQQCLST